MDRPGGDIERLIVDHSSYKPYYYCSPDAMPHTASHAYVDIS